jgi:hypothetical protein
MIPYFTPFFVSPDDIPNHATMTMTASRDDLYFESNPSTIRHIPGLDSIPDWRSTPGANPFTNLTPTLVSRIIDGPP